MAGYTSSWTDSSFPPLSVDMDVNMMYSIRSMVHSEDYLAKMEEYILSFGKKPDVNDRSTEDQLYSDLMNVDSGQQHTNTWGMISPSTKARYETLVRQTSGKLEDSLTTKITFSGAGLRMDGPLGMLTAMITTKQKTTKQDPDLFKCHAWKMHVHELRPPHLRDFSNGVKNGSDITDPYLMESLQWLNRFRNNPNDPALIKLRARKEFLYGRSDSIANKVDDLYRLPPGPDTDEVAEHCEPSQTNLFIETVRTTKNEAFNQAVLKVTGETNLAYHLIRKRMVMRQGYAGLIDDDYVSPLDYKYIEQCDTNNFGTVLVEHSSYIDRIFPLSSPEASRVNRERANNELAFYLTHKTYNSFKMLPKNSNTFEVGSVYISNIKSGYIKLITTDRKFVVLQQFRAPQTTVSLDLVSPTNSNFAAAGLGRVTWKIGKNGLGTYQRPLSIREQAMPLNWIGKSILPVNNDEVEYVELCEQKYLAIDRRGMCYIHLFNTLQELQPTLTDLTRFSVIYSRLGDMASLERMVAFDQFSFHKTNTICKQLHGLTMQDYIIKHLIENDTHGIKDKLEEILFERIFNGGQAYFLKRLSLFEVNLVYAILILYPGLVKSFLKNML